ncbi:hypothetical protein GCM10010967_31980 [Dyadobacter beijingensis]|uniref:TANFOR domain-containing protein n=1 Tax=Dyadobacter beijingensis TaxID=365489 RepID=A0ABQ2I1V7_9BACT|nr:hypothetical protein [Dyadobacter beijingensis]GGM96061.1 hypothetical protein GCM10010967_31980 [Dyadobacter beijingensis]
MASHFKAFVLLLWFCLAFQAARAQNQVRITTNVLPPYSPYIQDYPGTGNRVQVFITNLSGRALSVRLLGKLEGDNGVVIRTSPNYRPLRPLELRPTDVNRLITRAELENLFDLGQIEVEGMNKDLLYRGLPLPEGNYQLCVQAFDNATTRPLSAEFPMGCSGLIPVRIIEPPILISPQADEEVAVKTPQTQIFTWSAPVGVLPSQVEYSFRVIELPETNVDPNVFIDAVVLPRSGVEVKQLKTTTFVYGPQYPPLQKGRRYAWRVQAVPAGRQLSFLNEGKSPVQAFTYGQQMPVGIDMDYITITNPAARRNATVEVGSNNPFTVSWKLDEAFEKLLRKAFEAQPRKSLVEQFGELSYRVQIKTADRGNAGTLVMDRMVRGESLSLPQSELPANMPAGKNYAVQVELQGMSELRRKRAQLGNGPLVSKTHSFLLVEKNKGKETDSLTVRGLLAYRFPGESGAPHPLPNTKVMLMKVFPNTYRATVAYGKSDANGNYTIKVLKTALHGQDTNTVFTRCLVDPVHPFIQPIAEAGYYQTHTENTFQIASSEQGTYDVQGITWLAAGYNLDVTAKLSYKNWPGTPDIDLAGKHLVIYRKPGIAKDYDKYRLPFEGAGPAASEGKTYSMQAANKQGIQSFSPGNATPNAATEPLSGSGMGSAKEEPLHLQVRLALEAKGYQMIGIAPLQAKNAGFGAIFANLVYAGTSYDTYRIYCPDCGLAPDDASPVIFMKPNDKLPATPARVEKFTYNIQTTEAPTMTFTGKLAYKFSDAGKDGAQVKPLGNTQVHLEVVYRNAGSEKSTFGTRLGNYAELYTYHQDFSQILDTKVTSADGSFTFKVKMTKAMPLGTLPPTAASGDGEFYTPPTTFIRGIRVVVDNPYYASPSDTYGIQKDQQMVPQGSYDFGPVTAVVKSYTLVTQIKSDTTGISLVNKQKADIKSDLFGIKVSVLRAKGWKIAPPSPNRRPPADEGSGVKSNVKLQNQDFEVIATAESNANGIARFPRMVMANGEQDTYFISTESSVDGLNNYNLVSLKRITVSEKWGSVFSPYATQEEKDRSDKAKKTDKNGTQINCQTKWELWYRPNPNFPTTYTSMGWYTDAQYESMKASHPSPEYSWKSHLTGCQTVNNYWLGDKLHDAKVNDVVLLPKPTFDDEPVFAEQYKTFVSDTVKRHLAPGKPVVNVRVVDKANPTQGIKNATVTLTYTKNGAFMGIPTTLTQITGDDGWVLKPFQLLPGTAAKVRVQAEGYVYVNPMTKKASAESVINIDEVLLGQNSYYPSVLMEPNTLITGRAIDADAPAVKPIFDYSLEAYAQADDGNMVKTQFQDGTWKFALKAPSTSSQLKIFPVNISYFGEERNIKTQLPKPVVDAKNLFNIQAGDIRLYDRDHRIIFKMVDDISGKAIAGGYVRLFGKKGSGFEFGPANAEGLVEARFKNVSIENLYVEVAAPGYVTRTASIKNEESKKAANETVRLEPARTIKGMVVLKTGSGTETPLAGAEVFVAAGSNAPVKYTTVSAPDGTFSLDVSRKFDGSQIKIEAMVKNALSTGATYVGAGVTQAVPQPNGQSLKLVVTTFEKFKIASIWGFPVTIEKIDPKTLAASGDVDLTDTGLGPFAILDKNVKVRFKNVVFKADPQNPALGIPANETVELDAGILNNLVYHPSAEVSLGKAKYNVKLTSPGGLFSKFKIVRTPGTATGRIMAKAQVIDNSFNFSASLLSYEKGQFFLYDPDATGRADDKPLVTAFDASKTNIKWTHFGIAQENGEPMKLKLLQFDATSKLEGSRLIGDEIHLSPVMTCKIKDANPETLTVTLGDLVLKNNTVDIKSGETPLTFPLAGQWSVEIRDWKLDYKKGGFYATSGVIKTGKVDVPIKEFNLRSDFYRLEVAPATSFELAGIAKLKVGGVAHFGYDAQTGSDMKGHWSVVVVPNGQSPAAILPANSVPGLTADMQFATLSLLDNGEDVVTFGSGSKKFKYFNIIDVRPTTIETGADYFAFDAGMSSAIPNAPQDVSMRLIYSKPQGSGVKLTTKIPGGYKVQTKGYQTFEAGQYVAADQSQTTAIFFGDGVMAIKGSVEEPGRLLLDNVLLVHNKNETHITHGRNIDLTNASTLGQWKTSLADFTDPAKDASNYNESGNFKQLRVALGGKSALSKVYVHQSATNKQWDLLRFSGLPQGFTKMLDEDEKNRLSFTAYGEIKAEGQKIKLDGIDTGLGGLSLVYDYGQQRLTGSMQLSNLPVPPTMTFMNGMAQVRLDGSGFYIAATGELRNVPLIVPVTMRSGLMLGIYNSNELGEATQILFANSHRKALPCSFTSGFKGIYAIGEVPVPLIDTYKYELSVPGVGGYKVGMDAYVDGYVYGNYDNGAFSVGGGMGIGAHAYAYGSVLSVSAGGEVHVNGGVDTKLTVDTGPKNVSVTLDSRLSAGFSVTLTEDLSGLSTGTSADFCLKLNGSANYTIGGSPGLQISPECTFTKCDTGCLVKE